MITQEEADRLNQNQAKTSFHPYTCCGPQEIAECKRNKAYKDRWEGKDVDFSRENEGVLIATTEQWVCPCGKYTQQYR